jgi:hypothetical protein
MDGIESHPFHPEIQDDYLLGPDLNGTALLRLQTSRKGHS